MSVQFVPLTEASLERAAELSGKLYHEEPGLTVNADRARTWLRDLMHHPELGGTWIIQASGETVGFVVFTICYSLEFHGRFGLLDEFYIEEAWRGRGIGAQALAFVDEQCRAKGVKAVRLEVGHTNPRARALYERAGYRAEERHLMTKWL